MVLSYIVKILWMVEYLVFNNDITEICERKSLWAISFIVSYQCVSCDTTLRVISGALTWSHQDALHQLH